MSEIDIIFFNDGYNLTRHHLEREISVSTLLNLSGELYKTIDGFMDSFISRCIREGKKVDCRKGCYHCCSQAVFALPYEILFLIYYIKENFTDKEIQEIKKNTERKNEITESMNIRQLLRHKSPCPLLHKGICSVYEARPLACRTYISSGKEGCINEYKHPSDINIFPDLYEFPIYTGRMINQGICSYLAENQIFPTEWQIESMLLTAFKNKDAFDYWLKGENVFQKRNYSYDEIKYLNDFGSGIKTGRS
jgi:Fe-S-cluster containining protein